MRVTVRAEAANGTKGSVRRQERRDYGHKKDGTYPRAAHSRRKLAALTNSTTTSLTLTAALLRNDVSRKHSDNSRLKPR